MSSGWIARRIASSVGAKFAIDAENPAVAFVPRPQIGGEIVAPRSHVARRKGQGTALFALQQLRIGRFQSRSAFGNAALQFPVKPFKLPCLAVELRKDLHLGAQHFRHHRHRHVIDRACTVAAQIIRFRNMDGGNENDRDALIAWMLADHLGEFEPVQLRHADIHEDDGDVVLEQKFERFFRRRDLDEVLAEIAQHHLIAQQLGGLVVHQQHIDFMVDVHQGSQRCSHMRSAERSCSVFTGLAR